MRSKTINFPIFPIFGPTTPLWTALVTRIDLGKYGLLLSGMQQAGTIKYQSYMTGKLYVWMGGWWQVLRVQVLNLGGPQATHALHLAIAPSLPSYFPSFPSCAQFSCPFSFVPETHVSQRAIYATLTVHLSEPCVHLLPACG